MMRPYLLSTDLPKLTGGGAPGPAGRAWVSVSSGVPALLKLVATASRRVEHRSWNAAGVGQFLAGGGLRAGPPG
jgi:hypothetical protein